ncbi:MAG: NUDIX domain-containing protein [Actinobacteria bacterium]|nr:NUDIX domain-containing protein [Actinomycetota bacterium]
MRIPVVGVAIVRDGTHGLELLAARRTEPPELAGGWELPGGKVDAGETHVQAAHREIDEELAVRIEIGQRVDGPLDGAWPLGEHYAMQVFVARLAGDAEPVAAVQHDELRWLPFSEWNSVAWLEGDLAPVRATIDVLS